MVSHRADDRHYTVVLGIFDQNFTAELWRESANDWVLLSVRLHSGAYAEQERKSFKTLESALSAAEDAAKRLVVG